MVLLQCGVWICTVVGEHFLSYILVLMLIISCLWRLCINGTYRTITTVFPAILQHLLCVELLNVKYWRVETYHFARSIYHVKFYSFNGCKRACPSPTTTCLSFRYSQVYPIFVERPVRRIIHFSLSLLGRKIYGVCMYSFASDAVL